MNVVDSSGGLAYFANDEHANYFAESIEDADALIVPTLSIYEVFKRVLQQRGEGDALQAVALMQQGQVADLDSSTALIAARISTDHKLAMADSVMLASARTYEAVFWTQDTVFDGMSGVRFRRK